MITIMKRLPALALALCIIFPAVAARADDSDNSTTLVTLTALKKGTLPVTVTAYGQVQPAPTARDTVAAPVGAQVRVVAVQTGQQITKGAPLVTLVPTPETLASYRLAKQLAERTRSLARAHLATASDLAKAESDLSVLEQEGASGPHTIKAPYDAIVLKVDAAQGAIVSRGDRLIELAKPDGLVVEVGVDPGQAISVKPGDSVAITPVSASATPVQGTVKLRSSVINADTGLVPVQIQFPPGQLLVGEMIRAVITVRQQQGYIVPHAAILVDDDGTPYVVQSVDLTAKKVSVEVLAAEADHDVIQGKLDPKAPVVLEGNHQADDGTKLRLAEMTKSAPAKGAGGK